MDLPRRPQDLGLDLLVISAGVASVGDHRRSARCHPAALIADPSAAGVVKGNPSASGCNPTTARVGPPGAAQTPHSGPPSAADPARADGRQRRHDRPPRLPIFVSGQDGQAAANHDLEALGAKSSFNNTGQTVNPGWVQLNSRPGPENSSPRSWSADGLQDTDIQIITFGLQPV